MTAFKKSEPVRLTRGLSDVPAGAIGMVVEDERDGQGCRVRFESVERFVLAEYLESARTPLVPSQQLSPAAMKLPPAYAERVGAVVVRTANSLPADDRPVENIPVEFTRQTYPLDAVHVFPVWVYEGPVVKDPSDERAARGMSGLANEIKGELGSMCVSVKAETPRNGVVMVTACFGKPGIVGVDGIEYRIEQVGEETHLGREYKAWRVSDGVHVADIARVKTTSPGGMDTFPEPAPPKTDATRALAHRIADAARSVGLIK